MLEDRPIPVIQDPRDAIVRVTRSTICSSDLHIKHGTVPRAKENTVLGHEFVGEVVEVGSAVKKFKAGDRVSVNVETFCGECFFCKRGYVNNCVEGGWELGCRIDGCQAEYVRVPIADNGMTPIPDVFLMKRHCSTAIFWQTGYWAASIGEIKPCGYRCGTGRRPHRSLYPYEYPSLQSCESYRCRRERRKNGTGKRTGLGGYLFEPPQKWMWKRKSFV